MSHGINLADVWLRQIYWYKLSNGDVSKCVILFVRFRHKSLKGPPRSAPRVIWLPDLCCNNMPVTQHAYFFLLSWLSRINESMWWVSFWFPTSQWFNLYTTLTRGYQSSHKLPSCVISRIAHQKKYEYIKRIYFLPLTHSAVYWSRLMLPSAQWCCWQVKSWCSSFVWGSPGSLWQSLQGPPLYVVLWEPLAFLISISSVRWLKNDSNPSI